MSLVRGRVQNGPGGLSQSAPSSAPAALAPDIKFDIVDLNDMITIRTRVYWDQKRKQGDFYGGSNGCTLPVSKTIKLRSGGCVYYRRLSTIYNEITVYNRGEIRDQSPQPPPAPFLVKIRLSLLFIDLNH